METTGNPLTIDVVKSDIGAMMMKTRRCTCPLVPM